APPLPPAAPATEASTAAPESSSATASTTPAAEAATAHEAAPRRPHRQVRALRSVRVVQPALAALETHRLPREDQRHDAEQDEEADYREVGSPAAARAAIRLALTGPLVDRAGRRFDAGRIAPLAKARRDNDADDAGRHRGGDGGLAAIADFEADSARGEADDPDDAVVEALLADAPALGQLDRDVVDALALGRAEDGHRHLSPRRRFALGQEPLEAAALVGRERVRVVVDARRGRGRHQEG